MSVLHCLRSVHKWQCSAYTVHVTKWWMCDVCTDFYMCIGVACTNTWGWQVAVDCWTVMMCRIITLANPCGLNGSCVSRTDYLPLEGSYIEPWHPSLYTADDNLTASFTIPKDLWGLFVVIVSLDFYKYMRVASTHTWGWQVAVDCWAVKMCSIITYQSLANPLWLQMAPVCVCACVSACMCVCVCVCVWYCVFVHSCKVISCRYKVRARDIHIAT